MRTITYAAWWTRVAWLILTVSGVNADVLRVPQEYNTIQSAFYSVLNDDTVLVGMGTYAEELTAPPLRFWLIGDVEIDTGDYARPVIDPSTLDSARWRKCMRILAGAEVTIERMAFVNRAPMYPRTGWQFAGIVVLSEQLTTFRDCHLDSVYGGIVAYADGEDGTFHNVSLLIEDCRFTNSTRVQVHTGTGRVEMRRCHVTGRHCMSHLVFGMNGSLFEDCVFDGDSVSGGVGLQSGANVVRRCVIGPIDSLSQDLFGVTALNGTTIIEDNLFERIAGGYRYIAKLWSAPSGEILLRRNHFRFIRTYVDTAATAILIDGNGARLDSNVFEEYRTRPYSTPFIHPGIVLTLQAPITGSGNRFIRLSPDTIACISADGGSAMLHYNIFEAGDYAIGGSSSMGVNAAQNYWGHPSGPYNALYNPNGEGARIDNFVQFDPWFPDTNFFPDTTVSADLHKPLPDHFIFESYPNPFNSIVHFTLTPADVQLVNVKLYDVLGREVAEVWRGPLAFRKEINFDASGLASGIYFVRVADTISRKQMAMQKLVLLN